MDELLTIFAQQRTYGTEQIFAAIILSFILTSVIATVYRWTFHGFSYSRSFVHTMVLGGLIVTIIIMAIGNNLARGLGILGTLAIIRFRTQIRDPRDIVFLFGSLGIGIACGANVFDVAIIGTTCFSLFALLLHWSPFASRRDYEGLLRFMMPPNSPAEEKAKDVMRQCCAAFHMIAMREAAQGDMLEYSYQVRLLDPSYQADLVGNLRKIPEIKDANLLLQKTTVEL